MPDRDLPDYLLPTVTDRGFRHLPTLPGAYGGGVSVYESSAAETPHVWLSADSGPDATGTGVTVAVHLPAATAYRLARQLDHLLATHYHGPFVLTDARVDVDGEA